MLSLVPIYVAEPGALLARLLATLERTFGLPARLRGVWFEPELAFDAARGQYSSTLLLRQLLSQPQGETRILGVTSVDLFLPVLTYVFGEAQLDGRAAIVSLHRLRSEVYGLPANEKLLAERLDKEAVHELGHTYGLLHCAAPACVMHSSTYVEEIDLKSSGFCASCRAAVHARQA